MSHLDCNDTRKMFVAVFLVLQLVAFGATQDLLADGPGLGCNLFQYEHKIEQFDSQGRKCWGDVVVLSCKGRCDSREISYWKFPHKKAFHPVCLHAEKVTRTARLPHCEIGVEPNTDMYEFVEAQSCKCQVCSPEKANCVGQIKPSHPNFGLIMNGKRFENFFFHDE